MTLTCGSSPLLLVNRRYLHSGVERPAASSFSQALTSLAWLPSTSGAPEQGRRLFQQGVPEVHNILGSHAPYLDSSVRADSGLLVHLGVQSSVTVVAVLEALKQWSGQAGFETNLQHMTHVYDFLSRQMGSSEAASVAVRSAFSDNKLIWLPSKQQLASAGKADTGPPSQVWSVSNSQHGKFYGARDSLFYLDPPSIMEATDSCDMRCMSTYFASGALQDFFRRQLVCNDTASSSYRHGYGSDTEQQGPKLIVTPHASTADYISLLKNLAAQQHSAAAFQQARQLLGFWSACDHQPQDVRLIQQEMTKHCLLPAMGDVWVPRSDSVYLMDDEASLVHFKDQLVSFLELPPAAEQYGIR